MSNRTVLFLLCAVNVAVLASALHGIDLSTVAVDSFTCLRGQGYDFVVSRAWKKDGSYDASAIQNVKAALNAGFSWADVYLFPCAQKNPRDQVQQLIQQMDKDLQAETHEARFLAAENATAGYGRIWVDVETNPQEGCGWGSDVGSNCDFIKNMVNEI